MSVIHIATPDGKQEVYPEDQVREIWRDGFIPEASLYWRPGMTDWRPAADYFSTTPRLLKEGGNQEEAPKREYRFVRDPSSLTQFLKVLLLMFMVLQVVNLASNFAQLSLTAPGAMTPEAVAANASRQAMVGAIVLVNSIVTAIAFLRWVYWANVNSRGFGAAGMRFTPGWAVGWYFVPILALVRPYQAMREIWQVSKDPQQWTSEVSAPVLRWWWGLWVLAGLVGTQVFLLSYKVNDAASLAAFTWTAIVGSAIEIPLCLAATALISRIYEQQKRLVDGSI